MRVFITILLITLSLTTFAQADVRVDPIVDRNSGRFNEFRPKSEKIESVYLSDEWLPGTLSFRAGEPMSDLLVKYDIKNNQLEVKFGDEIKVASLNKIKSIELTAPARKQRYQNAADLNIPGLTGLVEELATGKISLYAKPSVEIVAGTYNAALDVGNRNDKAVLKESLLLLKDGQITDVTRAGKKIVTHFKGHETEVENYVKQNDLSYKKKNDLALIVKFINDNNHL